MKKTNKAHLNADLSGDLEYKACVERLMSDNGMVLGAAVLNLATGESLVAGEFTDDELLYPRIAFSKQPADGDCGGRVFSSPINEWVMRIDGNYIISCGSPGNRQFFLVTEEASGGLGNALKSMEILIGQGSEALHERGGQGAILENRSVNRVGGIEKSDFATEGTNASADTAMLDLFGLDDSRAAAQSMQMLVDAGATLHQVQASGTGGSWGYQRLRFAPDNLVVVHTKGQCPPLEMEKLLKRLCDDVLRRIIFHVLDAEEFTTDTDLPENDAEFNKIIDALRKLDDDDLHGRLIVGGFAHHSLGEDGEMDDGAMVLRCRECIYYLPHQRWCDLPELPLPVEPDWYCKLWKL